MGHRSGRGRAALAVALWAAVAQAMAGCALSVQAEMDEASGLTRYATHFDHVVGAENNLLDRALAECPEKTLKAEEACVKEGIRAADPSPRSLVAMVPQCRAGLVCHYDHTTRDRLGFVQANATDYVKHWRVDLDFRKPAPDAAHVPVTVTDRDDFDSAPAVPSTSR